MAQAHTSKNLELIPKIQKQIIAFVIGPSLDCVGLPFREVNKCPDTIGKRVQHCFAPKKKKKKIAEHFVVYIEHPNAAILVCSFLKITPICIIHIRKKDSNLYYNRTVMSLTG